MIGVRQIEENDLPQIAALYKQFWGEDSDLDKMKAQLRKFSGHPDYVFLCAEIDNNVVGTIMGIVCHELYGDCRPFMVMENLVTGKQYRKMGIGKALLTELETIAKTKDCTQLLFITDKSRDDAVAFYEAMGFNAKTHVGFKKSLNKK